MKVEAEKSELILHHKNGDVAIIPSEKRDEVLQYLSNGDTDAINTIVKGLPKNSDYAQDGTLIDNPPSFDDWYKTVPKYKNDTTTYNLRRAYELLPREELDNFVKNKDAHLPSVAYNKDKDEYEFLKSSDHPTLQYELQWYDSDDAEEFRKQWDLDTSGEYYKYIRK